MLDQIKLLLLEPLLGNEDVYGVIFNSEINRVLDVVDYLIIDYIYLDVRNRRYSFNGMDLNFYEFRTEIEKLGFNIIVDGLDSFLKYNDDFISQVKTFRISDDIIKDKLLTQLKEIVANKKTLEKYPNLNNIMESKDRNKIQMWMEIAIRTTLDNANTVYYVNNFISNGLNHHELLLCDSGVSS